MAALVTGAKGQYAYSADDVILEAGLELQSLKELEAKRLAKEEEQRREAEALQSEAIAALSGDVAVVSEHPDDGSSRKRRRGGKPVDYAALDKELNNV